MIETQEQIPQPAATPQRKKLSKYQQIVIVAASITIIVVIVLVAVSLSGTGMKSDQVKIVVIYSGDWHGWYNDGANSHIWSGHGETSIIVTRASPTATISALVMSDEFGSMGTITLKIVGPDGLTLDEDSADSAFNNINVSWTPS